MPNPFRSLIRTSAFWGKEVAEIIRQPRMIFTLVLGPFLILLIFGIGYQNKAPAFRTLFVAPKDSDIAQHIQEYVAGLGPQLIYSGVTDNQDEALAKLRRGDVDLVAVAPRDVEQTILSNRQAVFTIYQNQIDPFQANWAQYYAYVYVSQVNRKILQTTVDKAKVDAGRLKADIDQARSNVSLLRNALQKGDPAAADEHQKALNGNVDQLALILGAGFGTLGGAVQALGSSSDGGNSGLVDALTAVQQNTSQLHSDSQNTQSKLQAADQIDKDLSTMQAQLGKYQNVDSQVLVNPFSNQVQSILPLQITATDFYAPAVLALLLQHLAVTLAALSIVRERSGGTMELFRVSPLAAAEALNGKYLSYLVFGGIIAAILTGLLVFLLHLPMLGNWLNLAIVLAGILFTSLSIGFVISLLSQTDTQAVQYTMLVLLASVFFSGFIMSLDSLIEPVRVTSGLLPTTYGIVLLRDIMLRGYDPSPLLVIILFALGIVLYIVAWWMMHRQISRAQS